MESLEQISLKYQTDKSVLVHYLRNYEKYFANLREQEVKLLELGVLDGGSLLMWRDYFPNGMIAGLDINPVTIDDTTRRVRLYQGKQEDHGILKQIADEVAPNGFDIVIDDCAHIGSLSRRSYRYLFDNHLKSGGFYVIEDWGTGYWDTRPDGARYRDRVAGQEIRFPERVGYALSRALKRKPDSWFTPGISRLKKVFVDHNSSSHNAGMVGFVKELFDECSIADIDHPEFGSGKNRTSTIKEMMVSASHVFVVKK
ncbi:MAG: class I SAM-dependent methyltransferase [Pyrinomonadaceae bacterium]